MHTQTRREFLAQTAAGTALLAATPALSANRQPKTFTTQSRKRYALVGTGSRSGMYRGAILSKFQDQAQLVGLCDLNPGRLQLARDEAASKYQQTIPGYQARDFSRMIRETKPDVVIVTTKDCTHDEYIIRSMELGCDVITEKPMTTDEHKCRKIFAARKRTGQKCRVTFNYRYSPPRTQVKDLLMSGLIGDILSVDFHWMLDTHHGADYFRRWHGRKENSGGLMVHKATHHFDLINWWLSGVPEWVMASGKRDFYTPAMAKRLGLQSHHQRCHTCPEKSACTFYLDLAANSGLKRLYLDQEHHDGYFRDQCVWRPEINIEDTMNVMVGYDTGATLSYSLNAFNAWEGYVAIFNGTKGRIEHRTEETVYINGDGSVPGAIRGDGTYIRVYPLRAPAYEIPVWKGEGGHGGGDDIMLQDLFLPNPPADKYLRAADERGGACSMLVGAASNRSIPTGRRIEIADLVGKFSRPDYPKMPTRNDPVPMPPRA